MRLLLWYIYNNTSIINKYIDTVCNASKLLLLLSVNTQASSVLAPSAMHHAPCSLVEPDEKRQKSRDQILHTNVDMTDRVFWTDLYLGGLTPDCDGTSVLMIT